MKDLIEHIASLSPEKQEKFLHLIQKQGSQFNAFPLSSGQQRLWFLQQFEPDNTAYNLYNPIQLSGPLQIPALKQSLHQIIDRHEILRTNFIAVAGHPIQVVKPDNTIDLPIIDLSSMTEADQQAELQRLAISEAQQPFNLEKDSLLRTTLLIFNESKYVLLLTIHHIIADGWSLSILIEELATLYEANGRHEVSSLPPLPIQYADFAVWQQQWLQNDDLQEQLAYWQQQLSDIPTVLKLPSDRPRPTSKTFQGAKHHFAFSSVLSKSLTDLAGKESVTPFMLLLAAFELLLYRYSNQERFLIGTPIAGRKQPELENLIGFFVNTLVLSTDLSGDITFQQLLKRVRATALDAYDHQDIPFEKLVGHLQPERNTSHNPLFQVAFAFRNNPDLSLKRGGLQIEALEIDNQRAIFDLFLNMALFEGKISGYLEYDADLFEAATISRFANHLEMLLQNIVATPHEKISSYSFLTPAEEQKIIIHWNDTRVADWPQQCIHHLFENQVQITPEDMALVFENEQLTYRELNERANQLAYYLRRLGVKPEVRVGLFIERSLDVLIGILGVLKAGGAYVPLDPVFPKERIGFLLQDAQATILVTQHPLLKLLPEKCATEVICLDKDQHLISQERKTNPNHLALPENLMYVMYTSGSTGKPKGVGIEHRQLAHYVHGVLQQMQLSGKVNFATVSTIAADLGNTVLFPALLTGNSLHIIAQDRVADAHEMMEYCRHNTIDCLKIVPSHLAALLSVPEPEKVLPRQLLILGGEASSLELVSKLQTLAPNCRILNHYGPTETTVGVLTHRVSPKLLQSNKAILPLGRPLANVKIYILDKQQQPVPVHVTGEIYIGGLGVARGYLNRQSLTAEKFIPNPFGSLPGERLYKAGDLARYEQDGTITFLGRGDDQVKIRGYRIELDEIKSVISQLSGVQDVALSVQEDSLEHKQLIAYAVPAPAYAPTVLGKPRYELPNKMMIAHLNKNETDYLYHEIFELQAYLQHGITINDGDCVVDVGANIGLFSLFANQLGSNLQLYAFEPNPTIFKILKANVELYGPSASKLFNYGLSNEEKTAEFSFFPGFSLLSGFFAESDTELEVIRTYLQNQQTTNGDLLELIDQADEIFADRFEAKRFVAQLTTLSRIIDGENIARIDLLKINVEKSELHVLQGIKPEHWPKIRQIILEVDLDEHIAPILSLLETYGFEYLVRQDPLLQNTSLTYVYALQISQSQKLVPESSHTPKRLPPVPQQTLLSTNFLKKQLRDKLPAYMIPTQIVILETLPLTPNGKIDRQALPKPDNVNSTNDNFVAARTPVEQIVASHWQRMLGIERVGIYDNFFELGGHSLLATRLIAQLRSVFNVELQLRTLFDQPTIAELSQAIVRNRRKFDFVDQIPLIPRSNNNELPLSFAQQRLWFLAQLEPENANYNIFSAIRIKGPLNINALKQSIAAIVQRHEVLRTNFNHKNGRPVQIIARNLLLELPIINLQSAPEKEKEVRQLAVAEAIKPFALDKDSLIRLALVQLEQTEYVLLATMHHIVSDAWSLAVLLQELRDFYTAFTTGNTLSLPDLPIQYADYAIWQRKQETELNRQLSYWQNRLGGTLPKLELPLDYPRPARQRFAGSAHTLSITPDLTKQLKSVCDRSGATPFMLLLAVFKALLFRYTRQTDILIGTTIANRHHVETERLIGFFVNTLVLRTDLTGNPTFDQLLQRVRDITLDAYEHQDLPFEKLVETLQPERDLSQTPLVQVVFDYDNTPTAAIDLPGLEVTPLPLKGGMVHFDLTLSFTETATGLQGQWEYNTDLFHPETIRQLADSFLTLLTTAVNTPHQPLNRLLRLTDEEAAMLLVEWNATQQDYPDHHCLHHLVEAQAQRTPQAVAVTFAGSQLTYRELDQRSNQLAHYLLTQGVTPDTPVGICIDRSLEMVIAILGVLKAGGAYVPLDPSYPPERLHFMIADAAVNHIISDAQSATQLPAGEASVILPDSQWTQISQYPTHPVSVSLHPQNLAYIIYTSGSTGRPKGAMIPHQAVVNYTYAAAAAFEMNAQDRVLQFAALSFDVTVEELFPTWHRGGTVVLSPHNLLTGEQDLVSVLTDEQITAFELPTAYWQQWVQALVQKQEQLPASVRLVIMGGERVTPESIATWQTLETPLTHVYGLTETSVTSTVYPLAEKQAADERRTLLPLGRPIANTELYVLDEAMQPVPRGVIGELYLGGAGVGRGYWRQPGQTAARFVPHPFTEEPGARLYKTGDLVRYQADGNLIFEGRRDTQVKVRGYRIELGEVESVLERHEQVSQAVALVRENPAGGTWLVAYVVANDSDKRAEKSELIAAWRQHLRQQLPEYMVPTHLVSVEELPLTPNGKVDREALPQPDAENMGIESGYASPRNPLEEQLAAIWSEVLGLEQVGIFDNFFEIGGHSLLATQLNSKISQVFQVELPLRKIFEARTIAELAIIIIHSQSQAVNESDQEELLSFLAKLEGLSDDEARLLLAD